MRIPSRREEIKSQSPTFFLDAIRYLPKDLYSGRLKFTAIPYYTISIKSEKSWDPSPEIKEIRLERNEYLSECEKKRVIPFSKIKIELSRGRFFPCGDIETDKRTELPGFLFESGGKPDEVELYIGSPWKDINPLRDSIGPWEENHYEMLYHKLSEFASESNYHLIEGVLYFDSDQDFGRVRAKMRTDIEGKILKYSCSENNPLNQESEERLNNWLSKVMNLSMIV